MQGGALIDNPVGRQRANNYGQQKQDFPKHLNAVIEFPLGLR